MLRSLFLLAVIPVIRAQTGENVLLVVNKNDSASCRIADYYRRSDWSSGSGQRSADQGTPQIKEPDSELAGRTQRALRERGVLVGRGGRYGNVLILAPPFVIEEDALAGGLDTIAEVLRG